ncbi:hypothetical protein Ocin01_18259 [Orchesella cincta]|uniref:HAT C-terminal dimerisation domain-containing protein n=1 Tax=Orchesella cincta TaxID=48709 RepID=A0A1D2M630_ORCCI|nr:hypothetical protein Ocin01_18259 [Orchesella cincta]
MAVAPVAWALDKLQAENECYLGHLAPVLLKTYQRLDDIVRSKSENTFGWIIAECLKDGLRERFTRIFELDTDDAKQELLATVTLPWFKLRWIPKGHEAKRNEIKTLMIREALKFYKPLDCAKRSEVNAWSDLICEDAEQPEENTDAESAVELECLKYLQDSADSIAGLTAYPTVKSMSVKLNTPLPSSAPAERLFSYAGMVLRPKRSSLSDELFEQLVLLKLNFKPPN